MLLVIFSHVSPVSPRFHRVMSAPLRDPAPNTPSCGHRCSLPSIHMPRVGVASQQSRGQSTTPCSSAVVEEGEEGEEPLSIKSLMVSGKDHWEKNLKPGYASPPTPDHTHNSTPTSPSAISPTIAVPSGASVHYQQQPEHREAFSEDTRSVISDIVGVMDLESSGTLQLPLPYATSSTISNSPSVITNSTNTNKSGGIPKERQSNSSVPLDMPLANSSAATTTSNSAGGTVPLANSSAATTTSNSAGSTVPLANSSAATTLPLAISNQGSRSSEDRPEGGSGTLASNSVSSSPKAPSLCHSQAINVLNNPSADFSSLSLPPTPVGRSLPYKVEGKLFLDAEKLSLMIGSRQVGVAFDDFTLSIPVRCLNRNYAPSVTVKVIPRRHLTSKSVSMAGVLHIPSRCSLYKWLVHYSRSSIHISTQVFKEGQNSSIQHDTTMQPIIPTSELSCDGHVTHLALDSVLGHEKVVYDDVAHLTLVVAAELVVHGHCDQETLRQYNVVASDDYLNIERVSPVEGQAHP